MDRDRDKKKKELMERPQHKSKSRSRDREDASSLKKNKIISPVFENKAKVSPNPKPPKKG